MIDRRASSRWAVWLAIFAATLNILFLGFAAVVLTALVAANSYYLFSFKKVVANLNKAAERAEMIERSFNREAQ